jgi:hypothetical protein
VEVRIAPTVAVATGAAEARARSLAAEQQWRAEGDAANLGGSLQLRICES